MTTGATDKVGESAPQIFESEGSVDIGGKPFAWEAKTGWLTLYDDDEEKAQIFHTYYHSAGGAQADRPLTIVFNGGPGAASAYLHVGAIGPLRVETNSDGTLMPAPARLTNNAECWLGFTDLVFIDPVGTGLSHARKPKKEGAAEKDKPDNKADNDKKEDDGKFYWDVEKDLQSLCDFMDAFLSREGRWQSPIYLAGESYGGYRAGRLVRMLQEKAGIGLSGAFLISPALEWDHLFSGDFNSLTPALLLPSLAGAAHFHGAAGVGTDFDTFRQQAEEFALKDYLGAISSGNAQKFYKKIGQMLGLSPRLIEAHGGVVTMDMFIRQLKKSEGRVLGRYDAAMVTDDPFPASPTFEGVDPTLDGMNRVFSVGANMHIRENLGVKSNNKYELLNYKVNREWQWGDAAEGSPVPRGAMADMAVAMTMNPAMKLVISHGYFDLITPYFVSDYLVRQLAQSGANVESLSLRHYVGGHMFYTWEASRQAFFVDVEKVYAANGD